jgi:molecular chaperone HscB
MPDLFAGSKSLTMLKVLDSAVPIPCWSCSVSHDNSTLFCPYCSKIQPPPGGNYFSVFGLKPKLNLDLHALEAEFHSLSRKLHPDRFIRALENEKQWSLADTALLNDAYRTLKDPLRRTEYLLKLLGEKVDAETNSLPGTPARKNSSRVPADLLEEVFELNMQLEEMRATRKTGVKDPELESSLRADKTKFDALLAAVDKDLRAEWTAWDEGDKGAREAAQKSMAALLDRRRYLSNLVRDVNATLGV